MWGEQDFEEIEGLYLEDAETYDSRHPNGVEGRTLLISAHNLRDFHSKLLATQGQHIGDRHKIQLLFLERGVQTLLGLYWLCKNHCYSSCYGRIRFLLENYLIVRSLNQNKGQVAKKHKELLKDLNSGNYDEYDTLPLEEFLSGRRKQLLGDLRDEDEFYGKMYDRISNLGSHPHSFKSAGLDGEWNQVQELDILQFGLIFVYAIAAQYIRTLEETDSKRFIHKSMDDIIVQVLMVHDDFPTFLEEDMEFGNP